MAPPLPVMKNLDIPRCSFPKKLRSPLKIICPPPVVYIMNVALASRRLEPWFLSLTTTPQANQHSPVGEMAKLFTYYITNITRIAH